jgi:hypothetical protein
VGESLGNRTAEFTSGADHDGHSAAQIKTLHRARTVREARARREEEIVGE